MFKDFSYTYGLKKDMNWQLLEYVPRVLIFD